MKDFEGNDEEHENAINRITKENHDLKRELEEMRVSNCLLISKLHVITFKTIEKHGCTVLLFLSIFI